MGGSKRVGDNRFMKYVTLAALFGAICFAGETPRPACNARSQGQFWPAEANSSPEAARRLSQSGELAMCSLVVWKYKWQHLSVNVRDLAKAGRPSGAKPPKTGAPENK